MESNSLDCKKMFNLYKSCLVKDVKLFDKNNKLEINCNIFLENMKKM